ncbi:hypothetical protein [Tropicimonas sp. S265A]|uniref:hypothetical protein n=1 Tax=Tropicimonas sp. S265A TaxID=3415134 RepID=UPI003C7BE178
MEDGRHSFKKNLSEAPESLVCKFNGADRYSFQLKKSKLKGKIMIPENGHITMQEALDRGRQARAQAFRDVILSLRAFLAARPRKDVTA